MCKIFIDSFTNATIADLRSNLRTENGVLYALKHNPMVSTFDMSENRWLCHIIKSLEDKKLIIPIKTEYPWHRWSLSKEGIKATTIGGNNANK